MHNDLPAHAGNPPYASPVIRAPSPASSIGTTYGPDETSLSDAELSQEAFEKKQWDRLKLNMPKQDESDKDPLITPPRNPIEERVLYETTVQNLRQYVHQIEEDELFEQMLLRGSQVGLEHPPTTNNIDKLMHDMMRITTSDNANRTSNISDGPWRRNNNSHGDGSGRTVVQSKGKGKGKSKLI